MKQLEAFGDILSSSKTALEAILGPLQFYKIFLEREREKESLLGF